MLSVPLARVPAVTANARRVTQALMAVAALRAWLANTKRCKAQVPVPAAERASFRPRLRQRRSPRARRVPPTLTPPPIMVTAFFVRIMLSHRERARHKLTVYATSALLDQTAALVARAQRASINKSLVRVNAGSARRASFPRALRQPQLQPAAFPAVQAAIPPPTIRRAWPVRRTQCQQRQVPS